MIPNTVAVHYNSYLIIQVCMHTSVGKENSAYASACPRPSHHVISDWHDTVERSKVYLIDYNLICCEWSRCKDEPQLCAAPPPSGHSTNGPTTEGMCHERGCHGGQECGSYQGIYRN